nr:FACT complex subunit SSRP1 [Tanacetum cinerariifolium]
QLKVHSGGVLWKKQGGGKAVEVDKYDILALTWMKVPRTNQLFVRTKDVQVADTQSISRVVGMCGRSVVVAGVAPVTRVVLPKQVLVRCLQRDKIMAYMKNLSEMLVWDIFVKAGPWS